MSIMRVKQNLGFNLKRDISYDKIVQKSDEVIEFVWKLSQNKLYASYPRQNAISKLKEEIEKAIKSDNFNIIAFYHKDELCGVCSYFWIDDEKYAQITIFLIGEGYDQVADKFINYMGKELPGYELFIGLPSTNKSANEYFREKNIECIEDSIVTGLCNLISSINKGYDFIEEINGNNFEEYALFHDKYAIPGEMYFNSKNLYKEIEHFRIFAYRQDGKIHGSILIGEMMASLYNEFGSIKEVLYFIDKDSTDELNIALEAGFKVKEEYRLFKYIF